MAFVAVKIVKSTYLINGMFFGGTIRLTKRVLIFSTILSETFLTPGRIHRDIVTTTHGFHVRHPLFLSDFNRTAPFSTKLSDNPRTHNFVKIGPMGAELCHVDKHDEATSLYAILRMRLKWKTEAL
jgi:hypothetical protein